MLPLTPDSVFLQPYVCLYNCCRRHNDLMFPAKGVQPDECEELKHLRFNK